MRQTFLALLLGIANAVIAEEKPIVKSLVVGACAGCIATVSVEPLIYLKNQLQQKKQISLNPRIWYRSIFTNAAGYVPAITIQNASYTLFKENLDTYPIQNFYKEGLSAGAAGLFSSIVDCPRELISIHQQNRGGSSYEITKSLVETYGYKRLYCGIVPTMLRNTSFVSSLFILNPKIKEMFHDNENTVFQQVIPSIIAGALFATLTHPIDTIKTSMQAKIENTSMLEICHRIYNHENKPSVTNFYRGLGPRTLAIVGSTTVLSNILEYLNKLAD